MIGLGSGILGWGLPLAWMATRGAPVTRASTDLSSLMGDSFSSLAVVVTVLVGAVLSACGVWLERALRSDLPAKITNDDPPPYEATDVIAQ